MPKAAPNTENLRSPVWNHFLRDRLPQILSQRVRLLAARHVVYMYTYSQNINLLKRDSEGDGAGGDDSEAALAVPGP